MQTGKGNNAGLVQTKWLPPQHDDGNFPGCRKSLVAKRGHLENIFYNQMLPVSCPRPVFVYLM